METGVLNRKDALSESLKQTGISVLHAYCPQLSEEALQVMKELDFPTTRVEDWKYTRTTRLQNENWHVDRNPVRVDLDPFLIQGISENRLVFVNGFYRNDLSTTTKKDSLQWAVFSDRNAMSGMNPESFVGKYTTLNWNLFSAMQTAWCTDGIFIRVAPGTNAEDLHVLFIQSGEGVLSQPRIAVHMQSGSRLHLVTTYGNSEGQKTWINGVAEVVVDEGATLVWDKIQMEHDTSFSILQEFIRQEANSTCSVNTLTTRGGWIRNNLSVAVAGEFTTTNLNGLYLPRNNQHVDNHTLMDHQVPNGQSNELYKGVLYDRGRAVFNGKVYVRPHAQKTNAYQNNANIVLSDEAVVNTKPELEIYADDVKCSHGTTTGQFNEEALFYLRARGLSEESARRLLVSAFIADVLNKVENEPVRLFVHEELKRTGLLIE